MALSPVFLTCNGVPVNSNRFSVRNVRKVLLNLVFSFLMRCASSTTTYFQSNRFSVNFSINTISYDVMQTSHFFRFFKRSKILERVSLSPIRMRPRNDGQNRLISFNQFWSVEFGAMIKCGPLFFLRNKWNRNKKFAWVLEFVCSFIPSNSHSWNRTEMSKNRLFTLSPKYEMLTHSFSNIPALRWSVEFYLNNH